MMRFATALVAMSAVASAVGIDNETGAKQFEVDMSSMPSMDAISVNAAPEPVNVDAPAPVETQAQEKPAEKPAEQLAEQPQDQPIVKKAEEAPKVEAPYGVEPYPGYFQVPNHRPNDYNLPSPEKLPGPDFNKQVYEFDEHKQIWDQQDYTERVKAEAEILVALEAMKVSIQYLTTDIWDISEFIKHQYLGLSYHEYDEDVNVCQVHIGKIIDGIRSAQDNCMYAEHDLSDERNMLVLYCQQFAFAPTMVAPCAAILTCRQRHIPFAYGFQGSYAPTQHDLDHAHLQDHVHDNALDHAHDYALDHAHEVDPHYYDPHMHDVHVEPTIEAQYHGYGVGVQSANTDASQADLPPPKIEGQTHDLNGNHNMNFMPEVYPSASSGTSTHGINLAEVGGNVKVSKDVDPELAKAAYDQNQAVIVHEGTAYLAPIDAIDPNAVELACNDKGCALVADDGNPDNDVHNHPNTEIHTPITNDDWVKL